MNDFLPVTAHEVARRGWNAPDFVLVSGDPYIDHPSFGTALIGRLLADRGYKIAVLPQPNWRDTKDFKRFGEPRLGFLITSGSVDSMVANYTANKNRRRRDSLAPGGKTGMRPDRALIVYANRCREAYKGKPVILGGIEASLRRLAHYDYWDDKVRRSVLLDAKADILVYGMGELAITEIADALNAGFRARDVTWVRGTVVRHRGTPPDGAQELPSWEALTGQAGARSHRPENGGETRANMPGAGDAENSGAPGDAERKAAYNRGFVIRYDNNDIGASILVEQYGDDHWILQNPPQPPLTARELDAVYALPFAYDQHPIYDNGKDAIPALREIQFSIAHVRGCFGNCAFCAITYHQGRTPTGRSHESVLREAALLTKLPAFKGYIHDVGGPTANFRGPACARQTASGSCKRRDCLYPRPCKHLRIDHADYLELLRKIRAVPGVKKAFIRSGIRYDYVLADKKTGDRFIDTLVRKHVSGMLKIAPEHVVPHVLKCMRKPDRESFEIFAGKFRGADERAMKKSDGQGGIPPRNPQYLIPYFISAHPGCTPEDAFALASYIESHGGFVPDQVQDFYPTPGTLATCMYYTGSDPFTGERMHVPGRDPALPDERTLQRALLHHRKPEHRASVAKALKLLGREGEL
ncbi:MAG: YgiQ family radical SAM protein [Clostridiales Family XIII bacterium]|jgi:uncharacterized radical SAM protein YgiQ|nr:YgiQ family radical SAM protein [Clostridiales Family XIII bacterium]